MYRRILLAIFTLLLSANAVSVAFAATTATTTIPHPFFFTENKGQWDSRVLYKCNARNGMTWFLEQDGLTLLTMKEDRTKAPIVDPMDRDLPEMLRRHPARYPMKSHALKFKFLSVERNSFRSTENQGNKGRNEFRPTVSFHTEAKEVEASGELPWHNNYFIGNDSSKWAPNCRNYTNIVYKDVWDGIDIEWYEENGKLEFDFVVQPGADASQIRISCDGLTGDLSSDGRGELHSPQSKGRMQYAPTDGKELRLPTSLGELRTVLPNVYQIEANGCRTDVPAKFEIISQGSDKPSNEFGVTLPDGYQKEHTLRIDPLIYSTYLGGSGDEYAAGIVSDGAGGVIVVGFTNSTNFPITVGALDTTYNNGDCFVTCLNSNGTGILYSTYLGGSGGEEGYAIANDGSGGSVVTGATSSINFPTTNGSVFNGGSGDCFVARINSTGNQLFYSTYLGGSADEFGLSIINDSEGTSTVAGVTYSSNFPTTDSAFSRFFSGTCDCFVTKINSTGTQLIYSTYLGGAGDDGNDYITSDGVGGIFITGSTASTNFPITAGAYDTSYNGGTMGDCFIAHMNSTGSRLIYSTFLGGSNYDIPGGIAGDGNGGVFVTGGTCSSNFPITTGAYDTSFNGGTGVYPSDCFISHISSNGSQLLYSTFLGGTGNDGGAGIVSDGAGGVYVTGGTDSFNFPTTANAIDTSYNGGTNDCFIVRLDNSGSQLLYGTFIGGSSNDVGRGILSDGNSGVFLLGATSSPNYPVTTSAYDTSFNGGSDCFVARMSFDTTSVSLIKDVIPMKFALNQNYPNPFNSSTTISYSLPKFGSVKLEMFDLLGRKTGTLVNASQDAGEYRIRFDGKNLSSGEYFYRLSVGNFQEARKLILLK